jgi:hypothetical protein
MVNTDWFPTKPVTKISIAGRDGHGVANEEVKLFEVEPAGEDNLGSQLGLSNNVAIQRDRNIDEVIL